eukprot:TRINITY_DN1547_c0_g1_i2.p1 TRINITY_DN1547_c0_g1~~TRINITY_DN1547_c0_g1_i2.p1  ORF type:complete len:125 (+),score=1.62 TRINITY_DN1547_c0_g1_i2:30-404(+)
MATTWRDSCSMPPRHVCGFSVKNTTEFPLSVRATIELWNAEKELSEVKEIPAGESISFSEKTVEVCFCFFCNPGRRLHPRIAAVGFRNLQRQIPCSSCCGSLWCLVSGSRLRIHCSTPWRGFLS